MSKKAKIVAFPPIRKDNSDILRHTVEALELTVRSARRCAYDLVHCSDALIMGRKDGEMAELFRERANHYVGLFQSGNAMKDYRHRLHDQIEEQERTIERLRALLAEHKIDDPTIF
jgi:hypothetical protein